MRFGWLRDRGCSGELDALAGALVAWRHRRRYSKLNSSVLGSHRCSRATDLGRGFGELGRRRCCGKLGAIAGALVAWRRMMAWWAGFWNLNVGVERSA